jgi:glycosyltransferase involved in cell wall biosynthesis
MGYIAGRMSMAPRPLKILVISDYRAVASSRSEAEIFIRLTSRGHRVDVLSYPEATYYNQRFVEHGIRIVGDHPRKKLSLSSIRGLRDLVRREGYDIVHAFNSLGLTNAVWALRGLPARLIAYRGYAGNIHWYDPMMYLKYLHPRVDAIICLTDEIKASFTRNMPWARGKAVVIPKGHDPAWYADIRPVDRHTLPIPADDRWIVMVANLRPFKGLDILLDALRLLPSGEGCQMLFIGAGYDESPVAEKLRTHPWAERFHVLGFRKDAQSIVAACDLQVLASTHGEGLNKSLIEGMSLGVPAVMTDIAGNKPLAVDGEGAWIVPAGDAQAMARALADALTNEGERHRRGAAAKRHIATQLNASTTVDDFETLYENLLANRP